MIIMPHVSCHLQGPFIEAHMSKPLCRRFGGRKIKNLDVGELTREPRDVWRKQFFLSRHGGPGSQRRSG